MKLIAVVATLIHFFELIFTIRYPTSMSLMRGIGALTPGTKQFLIIDDILPLPEHYKSNADDVKLEVQQLKRMIERKKNNGTRHLLKETYN